MKKNKYFTIYAGIVKVEILNNDQSAKLDEWIPACKRNNRRAQEQIYRHYFRSMCLLVRRYTQDEEIILSIVNDGFIKIFKKIDKYDFTGSFEGWCRTIVFRTLSDHFRKGKNNIKFIQLVEHDDSTKNKGLSDLYYADVLNCLKELPEMSKKVFELYALQGFKHKEIAEMVDISEGTSKWHVSFARKKLQQIIKKRTQLNYGG